MTHTIKHTIGLKRIINKKMKGDHARKMKYDIRNMSRMQESVRPKMMLKVSFNYIIQNPGTPQYPSGHKMGNHQVTQTLRWA